MGAAPTTLQTKRIVDMRSDSYTRPLPQLWEQAAQAQLFNGVDPHAEEDPATQDLEKYIAEICKQDAALFMPSATFANIVCQIVHCRELDYEEEGEGVVLTGDLNHMALFADNNVTKIKMKLLDTAEDGTVDLGKAKSYIEEANYPVLFSLENTHSRCAGRLISLEYIKQAREMVDKFKNKRVRLHCDGSRLWHAPAATGYPLHEFTQPFHSITLCMCKALGAPMGAFLVSDHDFICRAKRVRRALGGSFWMSGFFAQMCATAMKLCMKRIVEDHEKAQRIVRTITQQMPNIKVLPCDTNIIIIELSTAKERDHVLKRCADENVFIGYLCSLDGVCAAAPCVRLIPSYNHTDADIEHACSVVVKSLQELHLTN